MATDKKIFPVLVVVLASITGLLLFNRESFYQNEGAMIWASRQNLSLVLEYFDDHQPLFFLVLKAWNVLTWPPTRLSMRILVLGFYLLSIFVIYLWANSRKLKPEFAFWVAIFTALNYYIINHTLYIYMYGMFLFLAMTGLYCFDRVVARDNPGKRDLHLFFIVSLLGVETFFFHYYLLGLQLFFLAFHPVVRGELKKIYLTWGGLFAGLFLLKLPRIYHWRFVARPHIKLPDNGLDMFLFSVSPFVGEKSFYRLVEAREIYVLFLVCIIPPLIFFFVQACRSARKGGYHLFYPLLTLSTLALLLVLRYGFSLHEIEVRYIIYIIPLFWYFVISFLAGIKPARLAHVILCVILGMNLYATRPYWLEKQYTDLAPILQGLQETIPPGEEVIYNNVDFDYYPNSYANPARGNYSRFVDLYEFLRNRPAPGRYYFGICDEKSDYLEERLAEKDISFEIVKKRRFTTNNYPGTQAFYQVEIFAPPAARGPAEEELQSWTGDRPH